MKTPKDFIGWMQEIKYDEFNDLREQLKEEEAGILDSLTAMILDSKKEEGLLAEAIDKVLNWVETPGTWKYNVVEATFSEGDAGVLERMGFLSVFGTEGWELCSEVSFTTDIHGSCTRYTFKRVER